METNDRAKTGDSCSSAAWLRGVQNGVFKNDKFFQNSSDNVHNFWTFSPTSKSLTILIISNSRISFRDDVCET